MSGLDELSVKDEETDEMTTDVEKMDHAIEASERQSRDLSEELSRLTPKQIDDRVAAIERAADAHKRLMLAAVSRTYNKDWQDFGGKPYLQGIGAERLVAVGLRFGEPSYTVEREGDDFFVECTMRIEWPAFGLSMTSIGTCSTLDKFFRADGRSAYNQMLALANNNERLAKRELLGHVKKKSYNNALSRGATGIMGIRGITWEALADMGITKEGAAGSVSYSKGAAEKKDKGTPTLVSVQEMNALPAKSVCAVRALVTDLKQVGKKWLIAIRQDDLIGEITFWEESLPDFLRMGESAFFPEIRVGSWQGRPQWSADAVEAVE